MEHLALKRLWISNYQNSIMWTTLGCSCLVSTVSTLYIPKHLNKIIRHVSKSRKNCWDRIFFSSCMRKLLMSFLSCYFFQILPVFTFSDFLIYPIANFTKFLRFLKFQEFSKFPEFQKVSEFQNFTDFSKFKELPKSWLFPFSISDWSKVLIFIPNIQIHAYTSREIKFFLSSFSKSQFYIKLWQYIFTLEMKEARL